MVGATNDLKSIDEALLWPGWFDQIIEIPQLGKESIRKIFNYYLKKYKYEAEID